MLQHAPHRLPARRRLAFGLAFDGPQQEGGEQVAQRRQAERGIAGMAREHAVQRFLHVRAALEHAPAHRVQRPQNSLSLGFAAADEAPGERRGVHDEEVEQRLFLRMPRRAVRLVRQREEQLACVHFVFGAVHGIVLPPPRHVHELHAPRMGVDAQRPVRPRVGDPAQFDGKARLGEAEVDIGPVAAFHV